MVLGAVARCRNYPNYVLRPGIPTWKGWDSDASLSWRDLIQVRTIPGMSPQWFGPCTAPVQLQCLDDLQGVFSYKCWGSAWHNRNHRPILRHRSKLIPAWKTIAYMALRMVFIPVQHGCHWKPSWWLSISTFKAILRVFFFWSPVTGKPFLQVGRGGEKCSVCWWDPLGWLANWPSGWNVLGILTFVTRSAILVRKFGRMIQLPTRLKKGVFFPVGKISGR